MENQNGLGDIVAHAFAAIGITKDCVQAVVSVVGIADCGCEQRQETLNRVGLEWLGIAAQPPASTLSRPVD